MKFVIIVLFLQAINAYNYQLWGEWKVTLQHKSRVQGNVNVKIYPKKLSINIRKEILGGIITCQKELLGSYVSDEKQGLIDIILENQLKTIDSILGIEVRIGKEKQSRVRGKLTAKVLHSSTDILVVEVANKIKLCNEVGNEYECLLNRITPSDNTITPVNLFLIGQFLGFSTSHFLDFILYLVIHHQ